MKNNIKINYLYRDAGNYKLYGSRIFSNNSNLSLELVRDRVKTLLIDGEYFEPEKLGIERLSFDEPNDEMDHNWHEIESIELTHHHGELTMDIGELLSFRQSEYPTQIQVLKKS